MYHATPDTTGWVPSVHTHIHVSHNHCPHTYIYHATPDDHRTGAQCPHTHTCITQHLTTTGWVPSVYTHTCIMQPLTPQDGCPVSTHTYTYHATPDDHRTGAQYPHTYMYHTTPDTTGRMPSVHTHTCIMQHLTPQDGCPVSTHIHASCNQCPHTYTYHAAPEDRCPVSTYTHRYRATPDDHRTGAQCQDTPYPQQRAHQAWAPALLDSPPSLSLSLPAAPGSQEHGAPWLSLGPLSCWCRERSCVYWRCSRPEAEHSAQPMAAPWLEASSCPFSGLLSLSPRLPHTVFSGGREDSPWVRDSGVWC
nr:uncharacterized protein LOC127489472 [Oryctolagus cuniculus]